jgi:hypothetical protein
MSKVARSWGLRAKVADAAVAGSAPGRYAPNPVASVVLASPGRPPVAWQGAVVIVGAEDEQGLTVSLTAQQLGFIDRAYRLTTGA